MPRPAPRVAPATRAARPARGFWNDLLLAMIAICCRRPRPSGHRRQWLETKQGSRSCQGSSDEPTAPQGGGYRTFAAMVRVMLSLSRFGSPRSTPCPQQSLPCGHRIVSSTPRMGCCISWPRLSKDGRVRLAEHWPRCRVNPKTAASGGHRPFLRRLRTQGGGNGR
jgi:hypothetical protein